MRYQFIDVSPGLLDKFPVQLQMHINCEVGEEGEQETKYYLQAFVHIYCCLSFSPFRLLHILSWLYWSRLLCRIGIIIVVRIENLRIVINKVRRLCIMIGSIGSRSGSSVVLQFALPVSDIKLNCVVNENDGSNNGNLVEFAIVVYQNE